MSIEGQGHSFTVYFFQVLYVLYFTRPRYQVSVYRTIGPMGFNLLPFLKHKILKLGTYTQNLLFILFCFRRALFLAAFCSNFVLVD